MGRKKSTKKTNVTKVTSDSKIKSAGRRNADRYQESYSDSYESGSDYSSEYGDSKSDEYSSESSSNFSSRAERVASESKIISGTKKGITVAAAKPMPVRALSSHEHDALNNKQTIYRCFIEGSLEGIAKACGTDAEGNQKPMRLFLGDSAILSRSKEPSDHSVRCELSIDSAPEDIRARILANQKRPEATVQMMSESPEKLANMKDIVTSVYVSGHSEIPRLELVLDNLQGCAENMNMSDAANGPTQSCVIRCESGHQLKNVRFLHNDFSEDDLRYFQRRAQAGAKEIDLTAHDARGFGDGVAMVSVHYDPETRHDVIDLIRRNYKNHPDCTDEQRSAIRRTKQMPEDILRIDKNHDDVLFVPKKIYEYYLAEHQKSKSRDRPGSDVAHPFGVATRMVNRAAHHFANPSKSAMEIEQKKIWTHSAGINVGRISPQSSENALKKIRQAWFEITVNHISSDGHSA